MADDLAGVDAADADLLAGELDSALDAYNPVDVGAVGIGLGWWTGRAGVAEATAFDAGTFAG